MVSSVISPTLHPFQTPLKKSPDSTQLASPSLPGSPALWACTCTPSFGKPMNGTTLSDSYWQGGITTAIHSQEGVQKLLLSCDSLGRNRLVWVRFSTSLKKNTASNSTKIPNLAPRQSFKQIDQVIKPLEKSMSCLELGQN